MEPDSAPQIRLEKYFFGTATEAERLEVEQWVAADPRRRAALQAARTWWDSPEGRDDGFHGDIDVERALRQVLPRLDGKASSSAIADANDAMYARREMSKHPHRATSQFPAFSAQPRYRSALRWVSGIAAVAILAVAGNAVWTRYIGQSSAEQPTKTFATRRGESANITLPDGTKVLLGADSKIRYPEQFGDDNRTVHLEGMAYFDVTHHTSSPFTVRTGEAVIRELGTSFSVAAYPGDTSVRVVVAQGRVSLAKQSPDPTHDPSSKVILERGALGVLTNSGHASVTMDVDVARELGWTKKRFSYSAVPLRDVVPELERWYDVVIYVNDASLLSRPLVATFSNESIDEILTQIATPLQARVRREGRTITIDRVTP